MDERKKRGCADDLLDFDCIHTDVAQASNLNRVGVEVVVVFDARQDPPSTLAHVR